jgi:putative membrane protein
MKTIKLMFLAALLSGGFFSCNNDQPKTEDTVKEANNANSDKKDSNMVAVDEKDSKFMTEAASGGMWEVQAGELAKTKGMSQMVKDFGATMVTDHSKANAELKALAAKKNITLPSMMGDDEQKDYDKLSKLSGKDFDKEYMDMMKDDHETDIKKFQDESKDGKDMDIKNFATNTLPTLQHHLDMCNMDKDKMKNMKGMK